MSMLGIELKRLRKDRGLTLDEASKTIGITRQYLSMLEKGERKAVSFEIMTSISRFYNVPMDYFKKFTHLGTKPLLLEQIQLWSELNEKVEREIYHKDGDTVVLWFNSLLNK